MSNRFADCPNVRSVILEAIGASNEACFTCYGDCVYDENEAEWVIEEAMARIGEILGLPGWKGSKLIGQYTIGQGIGEQ